MRFVVDLLISNGTIIDGSGEPGFAGTVIVDGDTLAVRRGEAGELRAAKSIDARGRIVCPGFIDLHSHAGLTILGAPEHEPKVRQGVTTELIGVDGISHAPFKSAAERDRFIWMDSGLNSYPPAPADWLTVADLLHKLDNAVAVNMAFILGNAPLRIWAVGWEERPATEREIAEMRAVLREATEDGAWALSSGLDYPPGSYADRRELASLMTEAARSGGFYHTHTRSQLRRQGALRPWEEALDIGRMSGGAVHFTHYYQPLGSPAAAKAYLDLVDATRTEGRDVTFDCYTYPYSSTTATILIPSWAKNGGPERLMEALRNPNDRARIKEALTSKDRVLRWEVGWLTSFRRPQNAPYDGRLIPEIAAMRRQEPAEALLDLLLEEELHVTWVGAWVTEATIPHFVAHPQGMIASDAIVFGDWPSPRTYGCFPLVLGRFVREEGHLSLPEAIRKMTAAPARRLGLRDRGLLRDGYKADIVIFDPEAVDARATRETPRAFPTGIEYVIVNGRTVIERGTHTGALPGRALRRGRD